MVPTLSEGMAVYNYESTMGTLPPTAVVILTPSGVLQTRYLGPFGRILRYVDQGTVYNAININRTYGDLANQPAVARVIWGFLCPSEPKYQVNVDPSFGAIGGNNYGFSMGDWYVWGGPSGTVPTRSAFGVNLNRRWGDFTDGVSQTLLMSEVKNYQPYVRDCGPLANIHDPNNIPPPNANPQTVAPEYQATGCTLWRRRIITPQPAS